MVASYSPHRQHGETAALLSRIHHEREPNTRRRHMRTSSSSSACSSTFAIAIPAPHPSARTRSATRRSAALLHSPVKFPLTISTSNYINSGMTLRSGSSSPRPLRSPGDKHNMQRQNRAGIGVENPAVGSSSSSTTTTRPSTGSPLKRSDGIMNLNEASRGSPVAKRRSQFGLYSSTCSKQPSLGSSSLSSGPVASSNLNTPPKRNTAASKKPTVYGEKPSFARSRPQARQHLNFLTSTDPSSRVRRTTSVENLIPATFARESPFNIHNPPLPSASIHPVAAGSQQDSGTPTNGAFASQSSFRSDASSQESQEWVTPQNYKFAKPNPAAFHSTGFVPKRGRLMNTDKDVGPQPDTPCKRQSAFSVASFATKSTLGRSRRSTNEFSAAATSFGGGTSSRLSIGDLVSRGDSSMGYDDGKYSPEFGSQKSQSSEYELPPTPTKKAFASSTPIGGIFSSGTKRMRSENSSEALRVRVEDSSAPQTPKDNILPPDPSSLSISGRANNSSRNFSPATPARDYFPQLDFFKSTRNHHATIPSMDGKAVKVSENFVSRFSEVRHIGSGQFSEVYQVTEGRPRRNNFLSVLQPSTPKQLATPSSSSTFGFSSSPIPSTNELPLRVFAVKKSKNAYIGLRDRDRQLEEVQILKELGSHEHVVEFFDSWEEDRHLYIQTEFCENGSLDKFLEQHGDKGRLDEFRVWKVIVELCLGLQHIHDSGFIHLDLKPANVLITFDGTLKISDFGMATRWPASSELEREGDREYIAPEVLQRHQYDKPVDIFALGLTIIETAGNQTLPPNGPQWQSLRSGDISVAPVLSTSSSGEFVHRDEHGDPLSTEIIDPESLNNSPTRSASKLQTYQLLSSGKRRRGSLLHRPRRGDLIHPPKFMVEKGLEKMVQRMIAAVPSDRPTATELLQSDELIWVDSRRRWPATIFEGLWGPDEATVRHSERFETEEGDDLAE
ncbi:mitosis inhibitor protein kinase swe1 [Rhizina undulata]